MQDQSQEIFFVIAVGGLIALLLVVFIISALFLYQRRQQKQEREIVNIKEQYQKELLNSQLEMQENTMKQIGEELHDNIKQQLMVVYMSLGFLPIDAEDPNFETIKESRTEINNIIKDIAQLSHSLHTDRIFQIGLLDSIELEVERMKKIKNLTVNYNCQTKSNYFNGQISTLIFRMFQETLQNILKHANASEININVFDKDVTLFVIKIQDNGVGFDAKNIKKEAKEMGIGLTNLFNRAKLIGADINIDSEIGKGTTVLLALPIPI